MLAVNSKNTRLEQLDVKTAFLNAKVNEDIYMKVPEGMNVNDGYVLKLNKALYGIKQAPKEWNGEINDYLINVLGFHQCIKDSCVYIRISKTKHSMLVGLFVDDLILSYNDVEDEKEYNVVKSLLKSKYDLSDLGELNHILGMRVRRDKYNNICIDQQVYVNDKLKQFDMIQCKTSSTPEASEKLTKVTSTTEVKNEKEYRSIVGSLIYASISTRPDITHAVNMVSRYMHEPGQQHMIAAKRVLRYLSDSSDYGLLYKCNVNKYTNNEVNIVGYCDADWGGDIDDRKSTTGYCIYVNECLVSWNSHKQPTIALSSAEAELMSACDVIKEIMWIKQLLCEMKCEVNTPIIVNIDNQSAMKIAENDIDHGRTKHIDIKYHFIKQHIKDKTIQLKWVSTQSQIADILTKGLSYETYNKFRSMMVQRM